MVLALTQRQVQNPQNNDELTKLMRLQQVLNKLLEEQAKIQEQRQIMAREVQKQASLKSKLIPKVIIGLIVVLLIYCAYDSISRTHHNSFNKFKKMNQVFQAGVKQLQKGNQTQASKLFRQANQIALSTKQPQLHIKILILIAFQYRTRDKPKSLSLFEKANTVYEMNKQILEGNELFIMEMFRNLGYFYFGNDQHFRAQTFLLKAISIYEKMTTRSNAASKSFSLALLALTAVYNQLGRKDQYLNLIEKAIKEFSFKNSQQPNSFYGQLQKIIYKLKFKLNFEDKKMTKREMEQLFEDILKSFENFNFL